MSDDLVKVTVSDGKYTFIQRKDGSCAALRYDEPWRDDIFDGLMLGMAHRIEELESKLAKAVDTAEDYKDCLNNWFDTKKLAENEIDPKIIQAASGYLRTSRSGGMGDDESDLILSVIEDMARLGVFSAIFTQFTLAELKGQDDE